MKIQGLIFALVTSPLTAQGTLGHWKFEARHARETGIANLAGGTPATWLGDRRLIEQPLPPCWVLAGASDRVLIAPSLATARLPKTAFTVQAWGAIDQFQAWGGIVSCLQDNGGFEKGWLLGTRDRHFCIRL